MPMLGAVLTPHPPVLLPEVGKGEEKKISATERAMCEAARAVAAWKPDVIIVASPHTILYGDYFHISPGDRAAGDMAAFGAPEVRVEARYDAQLRDEIIRRAAEEGLDAGTLGERDPALDHGVLIPLRYLRSAGVDCPIVRMGLSGFPPLAHYRLGRCVKEAVETLGRRAVFVASGDLSHKLRKDGPYGFAPEGPVFDEAVTRAMRSGDFLRFLTMEQSLCDRAAECGMGSFRIMAGALDGLTVEPSLLSHEGTFGVGYAVALFAVTGRDEKRRYAAACEEIFRERLAKRREREDAWVHLARLSLETFVLTGRKLDPLPENLPAPLTGKPSVRLAAARRPAARLHRHARADRRFSGGGDRAQRRLRRDAGSALPADRRRGARRARVQRRRARRVRARLLARRARSHAVRRRRHERRQTGRAAAGSRRRGHRRGAALHRAPQGGHPRGRALLDPAL